MINLFNEPRVKKTEKTVKIPLRGGVEMQVYKVPLDLLFYNDKNGRIGTSIGRYNAKNKADISMLDVQKRNKIIQEFIIKSDEKSFNKTKLDIRKISQQIPGVVLSDGRIIDGNRRFACLNALDNDGEVGFSFFETVILPSDVTNKEIKELELEVQYADKKVEYDPIEKLKDVYECLIKEGHEFTVEQYASHSKMRPVDVEKMKTKALLMSQFLESIEAPEAFYIAKDFKLDGYLDEIQTKYKALTRDKFFRKKAKALLNDYMLMSDEGGSKKFRNFINDNIIQNKKFDDFYEEYEPTYVAIHQKLKEGRESEGEITTEFIRNSVRGDHKLSNDFKDVVENYSYISKINQSQKEPIELLKKINKQLTNFDKGVVTKLKGNLRDEFVGELQNVQKHISEINDLIKNGDE